MNGLFWRVLNDLDVCLLVCLFVCLCIMVMLKYNKPGEYVHLCVCFGVCVQRAKRTVLYKGLKSAKKISGVERKCRGTKNQTSF